jgi:hypothetical protein
MMVRKNSMKAVAPIRGRNQLLSGIGAQGAHGIDLLGYDHRAQFAGHAGGVAPRHHQSGDERAQFGDHADRNEPADERDPAELLQRAGGVQRQKGADGESRQNHDGQGADADQVRLLQHVAHVQGAAEEVCQRLRREQGVFLNRQRKIFGDFNRRNQFEFERHVGRRKSGRNSAQGTIAERETSGHRDRVIGHRRSRQRAFLDQPRR